MTRQSPQSTRVALLQGDAPVDRPVECAFIDDSTIHVYLAYDTAATRGMLVTIRSQTIWPKAFEGACASIGSRINLCNEGTSMAVDQYHPCDSALTSSIEECEPPAAVIKAPTQIPSCQGSTIELDGSASMGGGARLLTYIWRTTFLSDNRRAMQSIFSSSLDDAAVGLQ